MKVVPAVSVMTVIVMNADTRIQHKPAARLLERQSDTKGLHHGQDDGEVAGPLRDLAAAQLAFLLEFFERGHHHRAAIAK